MDNEGRLFVPTATKWLLSETDDDNEQRHMHTNCN